MGRNKHNERIPQHHRHARERRWTGEERPRIFTVLRRVDAESAIRIMTGIRALQEAGELPDDLEFRTGARVELVPAQLIAKQTKQGIVRLDGRRLRQLGRTLVDSTIEPEPIPGEITGISMKKGGQLRLMLASEPLEAERTQIADVLEDAGFRGVHRYRSQTSLHMNLTAAVRPDQFPYSVRQNAENSVLDTIDRVHHLEIPLLFGGLALNPPDALAA